MFVEIVDLLFFRFETTTWLLALLTAFIAWLVYKIIEEKLSPLAKIPTPRGRLPLIGHVLLMIKKGSMQPLLEEWRGQYGPVVAFKPGFGLGVGKFEYISCRVIFFITTPDQLIPEFRHFCRFILVLLMHIVRAC